MNTSYGVIVDELVLTLISSMFFPVVKLMDQSDLNVHVVHYPTPLYVLK